MNTYWENYISLRYHVIAIEISIALINGLHIRAIYIDFDLKCDKSLRNFILVHSVRHARLYRMLNFHLPFELRKIHWKLAHWWPFLKYFTNCTWYEIWGLSWFLWHAKHVSLLSILSIYGLRKFNLLSNKMHMAMAIAVEQIRLKP